jgi:hypothetical protein
MPQDTLIGAEPKVRALGASSDRPVLWLGIPSQSPPPTAIELTSGRKPVDLDKLPAYLRDVTRFRR